MVVTENYTGAIPAVTNSYTGLVSIIFLIIGIILFATGIALKKKLLWILGLVLALVCSLYLLWMRSMGG